MTFFEDGSCYSYVDGRVHRQMINVGWLAKGREFPVGAIPERVMKRVERLCLDRKNVSRGFHVCEFCDMGNMWGQEFNCVGTTVRLGCGEIHVPAKDGRIFVAPDLIVHYIRDHHYLPPHEFLESISQSLWSRLRNRFRGWCIDSR